MMSEDEVKKANIPALMRTWGESYLFLRHEGLPDLFTEDVKKKCPWYFTLKGLISECPNAVPIGLGNNTAEYDTSILVNRQYRDAGPSNTGMTHSTTMNRILRLTQPLIRMQRSNRPHRRMPRSLPRTRRFPSRRKMLFQQSEQITGRPDHQYRDCTSRMQEGQV